MFQKNKLKSFPKFSVIGVPLHSSKLTKEYLQPVIDLILKRPTRWRGRGRLSSYAARITLIQSCLASIHVYLLSEIKFPSLSFEMGDPSALMRCIQNFIY
jgi:hypothetical protein